MKWYLLWVTRNGQRQWDGPYSTKGAALRAAGHNQHIREAGEYITVRTDRPGPPPAGVREPALRR